MNEEEKKAWYILMKIQGLCDEGENLIHCHLFTRIWDETEGALDDLKIMVGGRIMNEKEKEDSNGASTQ